MRFLQTIALGLAGSCTSAPNPADTDCGTTVFAGHTTETTNSGGSLDITLMVPAFTRSFILTVEAEDSDVLPMVAALTDPSGTRHLYYDDVWSVSDELLTYASYPNAPDMVVNWPVRTSDGPLEPGPWRLSLYAFDTEDQPAGNAQLAVDVHFRQDKDLAHGCLDVRVVYADEVEERYGMQDAVEEAVDIWTEIYDQIGVSLSVSFETSHIPADVPPPYDGDELYDELAAEGEDQELVLIVGETIGSDADTLLGEAGNVPGSMVPTPRKAVAVSWLLAAGFSGNFSEDEVRTLGETMAHEVGHYLGLVHPAHFDDSGVPILFDSLDDTPRCDDYDDCESQLGQNLMFPYITCVDQLDCEQQSLTADQQGIVHHYTGVR